MNMNDRPFTLQFRVQTEVNTDPERRCYNGCHFKSEMVWTAWGDILDYKVVEDAIDSAQTFKKINPKRQYRVVNNVTNEVLSQV